MLLLGLWPTGAAFFGSLGEPLVIVGYPKHHFLVDRVLHAGCQRAHFLGTLAPMFGVVHEMRGHVGNVFQQGMPRSLLDGVLEEVFGFTTKRRPS